MALAGAPAGGEGWRPTLPPGWDSKARLLLSSWVLEPYLEHEKEANRTLSNSEGALRAREAAAAEAKAGVREAMHNLEAISLDIQQTQQTEGGEPRPRDREGEG